MKINTIIFLKKHVDKVNILYIMNIYIIDGDEDEYNN